MTKKSKIPYAKYRIIQRAPGGFFVVQRQRRRLRSWVKVAQFREEHEARAYIAERHKQTLKDFTAYTYPRIIHIEHIEPKCI